VERVVRKFRSHEEAEEAEFEYYRSLTGEQRVAILLELIGRWSPPHDAESADRPPRVRRIARRT
jgi:hypothetical protein